MCYEDVTYHLAAQISYVLKPDGDHLDAQTSIERGNRSYALKPLASHFFL